MEKKIKKILAPSPAFTLTKEWIDDYQKKVKIRKIKHRQEWRSLEHKKSNDISNNFWKEINRIVISL